MDEGRLAEFLSDHNGSDVEVLDVRRLTVGHSRAMFVATTSTGRLVIRVEQGGVFGTSSADEFALMRSLHTVGYPVANVRWFEPTGDVLGQPFFVMDYIEAPTVVDERAMDDVTAASFVAALASLHQLDPVDYLPPVDAASATHAQIDRWAGIAHSAGGQRVPLLDEAEAWLRRHAPPLRRLSIVHGDAGPGNVVCAEGRVLALTDWEFAHAGDPAEDWSYCLSMRGSRTMPRERWLELFADVAYVRLTDEEWRYWEAFNLFKGACANRTCLALFETGVNRAPNMAIIGTVLHGTFLRRLVDIIV
jgi:aminoglycoside phosphotransferase (APT) family kinase protein